MKKGMTVTVYQDPITQKKKEGAAKLLHKIGEHSNGEYRLEVWKVKFNGEDEFPVYRTIREDLKEEVIL